MSAIGLLIGVVGGLVSAAGTTGAGSAAAGAEALAALLIARIFVIPVTGAGEWEPAAPVGAAALDVGTAARSAGAGACEVVDTVGVTDAARVMVAPAVTAAARVTVAPAVTDAARVTVAARVMVGPAVTDAARVTVLVAARAMDTAGGGTVTVGSAWTWESAADWRDKPALTADTAWFAAAGAWATAAAEPVTDPVAEVAMDPATSVSPESGPPVAASACCAGNDSST
jgi:hypothetical protein